jgi:uncharacterized protein YndB with AHSA1/START domain
MRQITVEVITRSDIKKTWDAFTDPAAVKEWNHASDGWECPYGENELKVGGKFLFRMSAKDKSEAFDFEGVYTEVKPHEKIAYTLGDDRKVMVAFEKISDAETKVTETFDAEEINSEEMQRSGWQAILDNFKKYTERNI